ncbi:MAG TPA: hypothetical protein VMK12_19785 [Anaeromyxobacteraceae bacterium]|nr:hypothetical protein [Anaeromyxobacteraceae bacterium]
MDENDSRDLDLERERFEFEKRKWDEQKALRDAKTAFERSGWRKWGSLGPLVAGVPAALAALVAAWWGYQSSVTAQRAADVALGIFVKADSFYFGQPGNAVRINDWVDSPAWPGARQLTGNVHLDGVRCKRPLEVAVSLKSLDTTSPVRISVAAPNKMRTKDSFELVAYSWGSPPTYPAWVEVAWVAYCPEP